MYTSYDASIVERVRHKYCPWPYLTDPSIVERVIVERVRHTYCPWSYINFVEAEVRDWWIGWWNWVRVQREHSYRPATTTLTTPRAEQKLLHGTYC